LIFAEVKPDFAELFSKSAAKVRVFFEICKSFAEKISKKRIFYNLSKKDLAISEVLSNFAHCNYNVQNGKVWED